MLSSKKSIIINNIKFNIGDTTRYGVIKEFIEIKGEVLMRSDYPYGTWAIEPVKR